MRMSMDEESARSPVTRLPGDNGRVPFRAACLCPSRSQSGWPDIRGLAGPSSALNHRTAITAVQGPGDGPSPQGVTEQATGEGGVGSEGARMGGAMPRLFWTGKLTLPMAVLVNANGVLAALTGSCRKTDEMTRRVKRGYEAAFSDHVRHYDDLGLRFQLKAAREQLDEIDVRGRTILDVGCGTGAISFLALERGAARMTGGDISKLMLEMAEKKASALGLGADRVSFQEVDAQDLPFADGTFDMVLAGQTLGLVPDQRRAIAEMVRVCRPGGLVCVSAHGPEHYWEAIDASFRAVPKRYVLGYRLEFWPVSEKALRAMMAGCGLEDLRFKRVIWRNVFPTGGEAFDFFAAISGSFWYERFPPDRIGPTVERTRRHFVDKRVTQVTDDVVICQGQKPWRGASVGPRHGRGRP